MSLKFCLILFLCLQFFGSFNYGQDTLKKMYRPEIFTNGFIDIMNNGQLNASARFIRLFIGEPGKFSIPLSFYSGVSANNFQNQPVNGQRSNDHLLSGNINPLSGMLNISMEGIVYFKKKEDQTRFGYLYHVGEKVLTGYRAGDIMDPETGRAINFFNTYAAAGLYFQTGAWDKNNDQNMGILWLIIRYHGMYSNPFQINKFLPEVQTNGLYTGYSCGFGIEINSLVNLKAIYYKYLKAPELQYSMPVYQFSFNYSMKK